MARTTLTTLAVDRGHRAGDSASWTLRYTFAGRFTLGNFPDMPLAQAWMEAHQARVLLDKQPDPLGSAPEH